MASEINYTFFEKKAEIYTLKIKGKLRDFRILAKIDFSSDRKRMSIIARDLETNKLYLFCKGADSIILQRIQKDTPEKILEKTQIDLETFSNEGLRTLLVSYKELDEEYFLNWNEKYYNAQLQQYTATEGNPQSETELVIFFSQLKDLLLLSS